MMRKILAAFATALLALAFTAAPASADASLGLAAARAAVLAADPIEEQAVFNCPDPTGPVSVKLNVCLYDWINYNYASGFFRRDNTQVGACLNINTLYWHDYDGTVGDAASSLVINSRSSSGYPGGLNVEFYEWVNCNESGRSFVASLGAGSGLVLVPNLADLSNRSGSIGQIEGGNNFYDTIQSIRVGLP